MSYGRRPSAHGGSDSQGAPCASCRHADDQEMSLRRLGVLRREGREMALTAVCLDVTDGQSPLWADNRPPFLQHQAVQSFSCRHLQFRVRFYLSDPLLK